MEYRKTALVLGGGGARGAYEIGVWQALRELGIRIDIVAGSSVGAINGAMIAQEAFDLAVSLWVELETSMVFETDLKNIITNSGLGNNGLKEMLEKYIHEDKIRQSEIEYGLVTVELPKMTPKYLMKSDIPKGRLTDYILASASVFPINRSYEIDKVKYVDGGFTDNLPVGLALDRGATHIIAVDLDVIAIVRKENLKDAEHLKIIRCPWDLGNILIFDKANSKKIMRLGYLDTMKAFQVFEGSLYCFVKGDFDKRSIKSADLAGQIFELDPGIIYKKHIFQLRLKEAVDAHLLKTEQEYPTVSNAFINKLLEGISKAKSTFNSKTLTLIIARSLLETPETKNIFLTKPAIKLLKNEIYAANYMLKEGLIDFHMKK
ncbi:patatin-like phospholipase family protein [Sinanaerobacter chloroacetimidivorans]|jgi:NTE family protein|uniref:Patatin-like phospholipase family protein n=1 Tax=Sinanaerobacter chloroacetimidivorans TaxID=2818044 RepID=A0A8J7VZD1_9FIRM|nr:patatin-like phospholipase family protein [Sinanaerobacter chloroacetimidivorans]MBR0597947.1 patatin-like phospholipase family protein [Sinanaerobacter chloroacetimidivorans]